VVVVQIEVEVEVEVVHREKSISLYIKRPACRIKMNDDPDD
jgi:hypothetical protein